MQDPNQLPDSLTTLELPENTLTPEEHEKALPVVQESKENTADNNQNADMNSQSEG